MRSLFRGVATTLSALLLPLSAANASIIDYTSTAMGGNHCRFDCTVHNDTLGSFSVTFDYLGAGTPGAQLFSIVDPNSFLELDSGLTKSTSVPLPGTLPLMLAGMGAMAYWQRRRDGGAQ